MKILGWITILMCGALLLFNVSEFPDMGDANSPANNKQNLSNYYLNEAYHDTKVPNAVTAVLADYRGYDTMYETTVILSAGLACFFLLRVFSSKGPKSRFYRHIPTGVTLRIDEGGNLPEESDVFKRIDSIWIPHDKIVRITCRLVVPFIQIFALYVIAHGHYSPGGGFQGGVLLGASIILIAVSNNLRAGILRMSEKVAALMGSIGVIIYAGTGALCLFLGSQFLDYNMLAGLLHTTEVKARYNGILIVEIGVALAVMAVMIWIYYNLSSAGKHDEGL